MSVVRSSFVSRVGAWVTHALRLWMEPDVVRRVLAILFPIAVVVIGIKAYKLLFALWPVTETTLGWHRPGPVEAAKLVLKSPLTIMAAVAAGVLLAVRVRAAKWRVAIAAAGSAVLLMCVYVAGRKLISGVSLSDLLLRQWDRAVDDAVWLLSLFRGSIAFLLIYAALVLVAIAYGRRGSVVYRTLLILNLVLVAIGALELGHYVKTGLNGSGPLLIYALKNTFDIAALVNSELDKHLVAALVLPFLLWSVASIAVVCAVRFSARLQSERPLAAGYVVWPVCLYAIAFPVTLEQQYVRLSGDPFATIAYDLMARPVARWIEGERVHHASVSPIPELRLLPTVEAGVAKPNNVVLVILESIRASATTVYQPKLPTTPFLAEFANRSIVVDEMYAVVPRTAASWIAILHGVYPSTNSAIALWGQQQVRSPTRTSLPRLLGEHGYETAFFVPTHLNYENEGQLIFNMGFDRVVTVDELPAAPRINYFGVEDRVLLEPMMQWVDEQVARERPFMLTVMTNVGHHKYDFPASWTELPLATGNDPDYNAYLNCVAYIDDYLRQLVEALASRDLMDSTMIVIVGDHGDAFGEHGPRQHAMALYEETLHVPMLMYVPGDSRAGQRVSGPRQQVDVMPTIAHLLGFEIEGGQSIGHSILSGAPNKDVLFFSSVLEDVALAMRKGDEKFIYHFDRQPMEIYDLSQDRGERNNLAPSYPQDRLREAKDAMLEWYERTKLTMLAQSEAAAKRL